MTSLRLRFSRVFGNFWWRRREGWYGRFVESSAYPVAMALVTAAGLALVLILLGFAVIERTVVAAGWSVVAIAGYLLAVSFLTSFGTSVTEVGRHELPPERSLARCKELLLQHGFAILSESPNEIHAARGGATGAEGAWRDSPVELDAFASATEGASALSVRCVGESGRHRFVRMLIARTAQAAADLDSPALQALDKTLVRRLGAVFQGGLATVVLAAMTGCAVLSTVLFIGASYLLANYVLNVTQAKTIADELRQLQLQLTSGIDAALRAETTRLAGKLGRSGTPAGAALDTVRTLAPFRVPGEFLAGVADSKGIVSAAATGPQWTQDSLSAARKFGLARLGNAVARELPAPQARDLETGLGLKPGQLLIGASLSHSELARFAPARMDSDHLEITFFDSTRSFLRYAWHPGKPVSVDAGSSALPADVLAAVARRMDDDATAVLRDVLFGGDVGGIAVRTEVRDRAPYRVYYSVARKDGGKDAWDGVSVARPYEPALETREWILPLAIALGLIAFMPLLIVTVMLASAISDRITRPALQLRQALRLLAAGDYSVRLQPARADELGTMQAELSKTAEELAKRDPDRPR